jgi:hydrogenase maturation protease
VTVGRILIAGIGNIFLGDDAFGVELANRLAEENLPPEVRVADFGIRGLHLAYEMLDDAYDTTILLDATPRGGKPGTVYLIEPDLAAPGMPAAADAHAMHPEAVFAAVRALGGRPGRVLIVGCEPACVEEGMGLSEPVAGAVEEAVRLVREVVEREQVRGG